MILTNARILTLDRDNGVFDSGCVDISKVYAEFEKTSSPSVPREKIPDHRRPPLHNYMLSHSFRIESIISIKIKGVAPVRPVFSVSM